MDQAEWEMQEGKRWKKKRLIQYNLVMLLLFSLLVYLIEKEAPFLLFGLFCILSWFLAVNTFRILKTGKIIGTKAIRFASDFDRRHMGEKRWKRRTLTEGIILIAAGIILTVSLFVTDFDTARIKFYPIVIPFIGSWIGYNIGELFRIYDI